MVDQIESIRESRGSGIKRTELLQKKKNPNKKRQSEARFVWRILVSKSEVMGEQLPAGCAS